MKTLLFLFLLVFSLGCDPPLIENHPYMPDKQSLVSEAREKTFYQLEKEKGLIPFGIGSGMMDKVRMIALAFVYYNEVDINKARELAMEAATVLLRNVNRNEQLHPYLNNYPFRPENIQIRIFLKKPNGKSPDLEKLTIVSVLDGNVNYLIDKPGTYFLETIYQETFEEAAAKLGIKPSY